MLFEMLPVKLVREIFEYLRGFATSIKLSIHSIIRIHPIYLLIQIRSITFDPPTRTDLEEIVDILPSLRFRIQFKNVVFSVQKDINLT